MLDDSGFNGVDVFAIDLSVFVVRAVAHPTLPGSCHRVATTGVLGLYEIGLRIDLLDVFWGNPVAPLLTR
jgi:hypothetical protein